MDDEALADLNRLAENALLLSSPSPSTEPTSDEVARWQRLFHYSYGEAVVLIRQQRADVTAPRISNSHWALVREEREAAGYDCEAYEHETRLKSVLQTQSVRIQGLTPEMKKGVEGDAVFLFRLGGLLRSVEKIQEIAGLKELPKVVKGQSERGEVEFCCVDDVARGAIERWLEQAQVIERAGDGMERDGKKAEEEQ